MPVSQNLRAFNAFAAANDRNNRKISDEHIDLIVRTKEVPHGLAPRDTPVEKRARAVLLRRSAGPARATVFDGGHQGDMPCAIEWLSRQRR